MFRKTDNKNPVRFSRVTQQSSAKKLPAAPSKKLAQPPRNAATGDVSEKRRNKQLQRVETTSKLVNLAKVINLKARLPDPTTANIQRLMETADTLAGCVNYTKQKVDDAYMADLTRPGYEDPAWPTFAQKASIQLPKRRTDAEQQKIAEARRAKDEEDKKLPVADRANKYIREANAAKAKKAADRQAKSKQDVLTSGLDTRGDPNLEDAEKRLSPEERKLSPVLASVQDAFECSHALLLLLSHDTPEARTLSTTLKAVLQEQKSDPTLKTTSAEDLAGQLLVQPFARVCMLARGFKGYWDAAETSRQGLEAIRAAGGEPTTEQLDSATDAQKRLRACAEEIIDTYDRTFLRLETVGKLFTSATDLPAEQLAAVHAYGDKLLDYASMLALPSSVPMQLKMFAHSVVEADNAAKARAQASGPAAPSDNAVAVGSQAAQLPSKASSKGKPNEEAKALVVRFGLPVSPIQGPRGRINRMLPPLPFFQDVSPAAA